MNKLTKAAIAGAAGIILLLGGTGSLALWNATTAVGAGDINTGTLTVTASGGTWDTGITSWVPGDSYVYTTDVVVHATGDHIKGMLSVDKSSITGGTDLQNNLTVSLAVPGTLPTGVTDNGDGTYKINAKEPTTTGYELRDVTVTVTLPSSVTSTTAQGQTVHLANLAFKVEQIAP